MTISNNSVNNNEMYSDSTLLMHILIHVFLFIVLLTLFFNTNYLADITDTFKVTSYVTDKDSTPPIISEYLLSIFMKFAYIATFIINVKFFFKQIIKYFRK